MKKEVPFSCNNVTLNGQDITRKADLVVGLKASQANPRTKFRKPFTHCTSLW